MKITMKRESNLWTIKRESKLRHSYSKVTEDSFKKKDYVSVSIAMKEHPKKKKEKSWKGETEIDGHETDVKQIHIKRHK